MSSWIGYRMWHVDTQQFDIRVSRIDRRMDLASLLGLPEDIISRMRQLIFTQRCQSLQELLAKIPRKTSCLIGDMECVQLMQWLPSGRHYTILIVPTQDDVVKNIFINE